MNEEKTLLADKYISISELKAHGWKPCTAQEAGAPEESWRPQKDETYYYSCFDGSTIYAENHRWYGSDVGYTRLAIGNVHKTPEEAIAWLKSKLDLKV